LTQPSTHTDARGYLLLLPEVDVQLPACATGGLEAASHVLVMDELVAINAALAAGRPLLLRGEPGVGKSQLARAAAVALGRAFVHQTVDAQTEAHELLWRLDAVGRLGAAQLLAHGGDRASLSIERFVQPGALWWAFDWPGAKRQAAKAGGAVAARAYGVGPDGDDCPDNGVVVLIDEIDKAEASVPNGLLEALAGGAFAPPGCAAVMRGTPRPLVVIATNEERPMPDAFLRRCLLLHLRLPEDKDEVVAHLLRRSKGLLDRVDEAVQGEVAAIIAADRFAQGRATRARIGLAEHLDLLRALAELAPNDPAAQRALLAQLKQLVLFKRRAPGA
jgi:MoxR-like ATPase